MQNTWGEFSWEASWRSGHSVFEVGSTVRARGKGLAGLQGFEQISSGLNDQSKIAGSCSVVGKSFPKGDAAFDAFAEVLLVLRASLLFKDITSANEMTEEFLYGKPERQPSCRRCSKGWRSLNSWN